jgi:hypothetical protein
MKKKSEHALPSVRDNRSDPAMDRGRARFDPFDPLLEVGFVRVTDTRAYTGIHPQHFRKLSRAGRAPAITKVGGRAVVRRRDLREWLERQS